MSLPDGPPPSRTTTTTTTNGEPRRGGSVTVATAAPGTLPVRPANERCDHCGAPVEGTQRYCVQCGTSQRRADDPTARWFAAARRAKVAPGALAVAEPGLGSGRTVPAGVAAVLIALLPIAAGIGVLVGRGSDDSGRAVVDALKAVNAKGGLAVGAANVAATTPDAAAADTADAADDSAGDAKTTKKVGDIEVTDEQAPVLATGPTGSARKLTGTKPTEKDVKESKDALSKIESKKGEDYVEQQKDLPDTIVIP